MIRSIRALSIFLLILVGGCDLHFADMDEVKRKIIHAEYQRLAQEQCRQDPNAPIQIATAEGGVLIVGRCGDVGAVSLLPVLLPLAIEAAVRAVQAQGYKVTGVTVSPSRGGQ